MTEPLDQKPPILNLAAPFFPPTNAWLAIPKSVADAGNFFICDTLEDALKCAHRAAQDAGEDVYLLQHPAALVYAPTPTHPTGQD